MQFLQTLPGFQQTKKISIISKMNLPNKPTSCQKSSQKFNIKSYKLATWQTQAIEI